MSSIGDISESIKNSLDLLSNAIQNEQEEKAHFAWMAYKKAKGSLDKHLRDNHLDKKGTMIYALILRLEYDMQHIKFALDHTREGSHLEQLKGHLIKLHQDSNHFFALVNQINTIKEKI